MNIDAVGIPIYLIKILCIANAKPQILSVAWVCLGKQNWKYPLQKSIIAMVNQSKSVILGLHVLDTRLIICVVTLRKKLKAKAFNENRRLES